VVNVAQLWNAAGNLAEADRKAALAAAASSKKK
jgi:hypothetical protein